jgi:hypothetical protein
MNYYELKKANEENDPRRLDDDVDLAPVPPRDPIEPDPMNPAPVDADPKPPRRPDLTWTEHED